MALEMRSRVRRRANRPRAEGIRITKRANLICGGEGPSGYRGASRGRARPSGGRCEDDDERTAAAVANERGSASAAPGALALIGNRASTSAPVACERNTARGDIEQQHPQSLIRNAASLALPSVVATCVGTSSSREDLALASRRRWRCYRTLPNKSRMGRIA